MDDDEREGVIDDGDARASSGGGVMVVGGREASERWGEVLEVRRVLIASRGLAAVAEQSLFRGV